MEDVILGAHDMCNARRKATVKKKTDADKSWKKHQSLCPLLRGLPSKMRISLVFATFQRSSLYSLSLNLYTLQSWIIDTPAMCLGAMFLCKIGASSGDMKWHRQLRIQFFFKRWGPSTLIARLGTHTSMNRSNGLPLLIFHSLWAQFL